MEMFLNNFTIIETILRDRASFFAAIRDNIDLWTKIEAMLVSHITFFAIYMKAIAPAALRHRLLLNFEGQAEGITTDEVNRGFTGKATAVGANLDTLATYSAWGNGTLPSFR